MHSLCLAVAFHRRIRPAWSRRGADPQRQVSSASRALGAVRHPRAACIPAYFQRSHITALTRRAHTLCAPLGNQTSVRDTAGARTAAMRAVAVLTLLLAAVLTARGECRWRRAAWRRHAQGGSGGVGGSPTHPQPGSLITPVPGTRCRGGASQRRARSPDARTAARRSPLAAAMPGSSCGTVSPDSVLECCQRKVDEDISDDYCLETYPDVSQRRCPGGGAPAERYRRGSAGGYRKHMHIPHNPTTPDPACAPKQLPCSCTTSPWWAPPAAPSPPTPASPAARARWMRAPPMPGARRSSPRCGGGLRSCFHWHQPVACGRWRHTGQGLPTWPTNVPPIPPAAPRPQLYQPEPQPQPIVGASCGTVAPDDASRLACCEDAVAANKEDAYCRESFPWLYSGGGKSNASGARRAAALSRRGGGTTARTIARVRPAAPRAAARPPTRL